MDGIATKGAIYRYIIKTHTYINKYTLNIYKIQRQIQTQTQMPSICICIHIYHSPPSIPSHLPSLYSVSSVLFIIMYQVVE